MLDSNVDSYMYIYIYVYIYIYLYIYNLISFCGEENRIQLFDNKVFKTIFEPYRGIRSWETEILHGEEVYDSEIYSRCSRWSV
jgi:hypothetical protein